MRNVIVPFFISHQGCPHTCLFCDQRTISGSAGALPGRSELLSKISRWRSSVQGRPVEVAFFGGTFTALQRADQQRLLDPLQSLLDQGAVTGIRVSTRPDAVDAETVAWLACRGVRTIELGVQSMDDAVLNASGRGHTAAASASALACVAAMGLRPVAQLMPGLPEDTPTRSLRSLSRVIAAGAAGVRVYPAVVLEGTGLADLYRLGRYRPLELAAGIALCKQMLLIALKAGVEVLRIGLQADEGLSSAGILAGCWHPALGQLVRSELYHDLLLQLLDNPGCRQGLALRCHPSRLSDVRGQRNENLDRLARQGFSVERVLPEQGLSQYEVEVVGQDFSRRGSLISDLTYPDSFAAEVGHA